MRHGRCVFVGKKMNYNDVIKLACVLIHAYIYIYNTCGIIHNYCAIEILYRHPRSLSPSLSLTRSLSLSLAQKHTLDNRLYTHHIFFSLYNTTNNIIRVGTYGIRQRGRRTGRTVCITK